MSFSRETRPTLDQLLYDVALAQVSGQKSRVVIEEIRRPGLYRAVAYFEVLSAEGAVPHGRPS